MPSWRLGRRSPTLEFSLTAWEQYAIPKLLKLEKVMPGLVQCKVVPKKLSKGIVKKNDLHNVLGIFKAKPYLLTFSKH